MTITEERQYKGKPAKIKMKQSTNKTRQEFQHKKKRGPKKKKCRNTHSDSETDDFEAVSSVTTPPTPPTPPPVKFEESATQSSVTTVPAVKQKRSEYAVMQQIICGTVALGKRVSKQIKN